MNHETIENNHLSCGFGCPVGPGSGLSGPGQRRDRQHPPGYDGLCRRALLYWYGTRRALLLGQWCEDRPATGGASVRGYINSIFVDHGAIYAAGYLFSNGTEVPCVWVNGVKTDLPTPGSVSGEAKSIYISGGNVYVSGTYYSLNNKPCIWVNGVRTDLSTGFSSYVGWATSIFVANNHVYVGGRYSNQYGYLIPCYWVDGVKTDLPFGSMASDGEVYSIFVSGGSVYLAGYYTDASTSSDTPCLWINSVLTPFPVPISGPYNSANAVFVSSGKVYVGGIVDSGSTGCYWVDGARTDISGSSGVYGIFVLGGNVYTVGNFDVVPGLWMNSTRIELPLPAGSSDGSATSVFVE
jgi:hypothetical protein